MSRKKFRWPTAWEWVVILLLLGTGIDFIAAAQKMGWL